MEKSMSASVCALETNPASKAEGARYTPRSSAARCQRAYSAASARFASAKLRTGPPRSEEHTSELQSRVDLVCRLLLEKKNSGHGTRKPKAALSKLPAPCAADLRGKVP